MRCDLRRNLVERQPILTWGARVRGGAAQESGPVWLAPGRGRGAVAESASQATPGGPSLPFKAPHYPSRKPHNCASAGAGAGPSSLGCLHPACGFSTRAGRSTATGAPRWPSPTPTAFCDSPLIQQKDSS